MRKLSFMVSSKGPVILTPVAMKLPVFVTFTSLAAGVLILTSCMRYERSITVTAVIIFSKRN